jgi:hypothetical protein
MAGKLEIGNRCSKRALLSVNVPGIRCCYFLVQCLRLIRLLTVYSTQMRRRLARRSRRTNERKYGRAGSLEYERR